MNMRNGGSPQRPWTMADVVVTIVIAVGLLAGLALMVVGSGL